MLKARAITETSYLLTPEQCGALEARVLPRPHDYRPNPIDQTHPPPETHAPGTSAPPTGVRAEYNPDLDPPPF